MFREAFQTQLLALAFQVRSSRPVVSSADGDGGRKSPEHPAHVGILSTPTPYSH
jgi:hypothetical protein